MFINYDLDDFEHLKSENEFFALMGNTLPPIPVESIKRNNFLIIPLFNQVLVFMIEDKPLVRKAWQKGALCFCFDDYAKRHRGIIKQFHFRIDLSEGFKGWQFLEPFRELPI